jgi:hypothetical protein
MKSPIRIAIPNADPATGSPDFLATQVTESLIQTRRDYRMRCGCGRFFHD